MIAGRKTTDESIYGLIYEPEVVPQKPARYKSMYSSNVKEEKKQHKSEHATMGQAKVPLLSPEKFLAKHSKEFKLPAKKQFNYPDQDTCRPLVPMIDDKPVMGLKSNKNFITTNAVENITSIPKKAVPKVVDTRGGDTHPLDASGLAPKYVKKKDYGEIPTYLARRQQEIETAQEEYNRYVAEYHARGAMKQLSEDERNTYLQGLKKNWEELHHQYQGLSVVTDTAPKKNRKERMEAEMKQLERDIETIEKYKVINVHVGDEARRADAGL